MPTTVDKYKNMYSLVKLAHIFKKDLYDLNKNKNTNVESIVNKAKSYGILTNLDKDNTKAKELIENMADTMFNTSSKTFGILKNEDGKLGNPPKFKLDPSNKKVIRDVVDNSNRKYRFQFHCLLMCNKKPTMHYLRFLIQFKEQIYLKIYNAS